MDQIVRLNNILQSFKIKATCLDYQCIGNYCFYDLKLNANAKVKDIQKYKDEISLALNVNGKPNVNILYKEGIVRLEFGNTNIKTLNLFNYFTNNSPKGELPCLLGQGVDGEKVWMDIAKNPHMIVAGTTGSGKSVLLHNIIANLLNYSNAHISLIDPKGIEFSKYECKFNNIVVDYSYSNALNTIKRAIEIMEYRYDLIKNGFNIENISHSVIIIDEFADLIMQDKDKELYTKLCQLAQKCRSSKISIILATQRPSVNIINGAIKSNFPARIACRVANHVDSKVILDSVGAENLLGNGDALLRDNIRFLDRFQIAYTDSTEVCKYFCK